MSLDWSDLEVFTKIGRKMGSPFVTISVGQLITLSSGFLHSAKNNIATNTHAILSFSKLRNAIVFGFGDEESPGAMKMTFRNNAKNACICSKSFFAYYHIDTIKYAGRHKAILENIPGRGETWVVYLDPTPIQQCLRHNTVGTGTLLISK